MRTGRLIPVIKPRISRCPKCGALVSMPGRVNGTIPDDNEVIHDCNSSKYNADDYDRKWLSSGHWIKRYNRRYSRTIKNPRSDWRGLR